MDQLHGHDCHQNVTEPQATGYHTKSTHVAGPAHAASHIDESTLASFIDVLPVAPIAVARRDLSPVKGGS